MLENRYSFETEDVKTSSTTGAVECISGARRVLYGDA